MALSVVWITTTISIFALLWKILRIGTRDSRMPKGPRTLPLIGNTHLIPKTGLHKRYPEWAQKYGKVFSLKVGAANMIVLCDRKAVQKLLVEKGSIYSDRPPNYISSFITRGDHLILENLTPVGRLKRKIITQHFSPKEIEANHHKTQAAESTVLMNNFMINPDGFYEELRRYTISVICCITFGHNAPDTGSFWYRDIDDLLVKWFEATEPGANPPIESFPLLAHIPSRFASWKRRAIRIREQMDHTYGGFRKLVEERRQRGYNRTSIADSLLDEYADGKLDGLTMHAVDNLLGEIVEGGTDTTASQLQSLVLAITLFPEVQIKARKEIDAVCGTGRSPSWSDFEKLPYVNAIVKEAARWRSSAAVSLPHYTREDDTYEGMLIPKNSMIVLAIEAIHHDEETVNDTQRFMPERYLNHTGLANEYAANSDWNRRDHYIYGAGRRICPGIHLAERSMWRVAAKLLWAFDFQEPVDPTSGRTERLDPYAYTTGAVYAPLPFRLRIKVRSDAHRATIQRENIEALKELEKFS